MNGSKEYQAELERLQVELAKLQHWVQTSGARIVVLFEGRDAAGKGGAIKRITERMNPRVCKVVALAAPNEQERTQWYFQRYVANLPSAGQIVLFDRSWYNRAGIERVMGFCTEEELQEFLRSCPEFERMLIRSGIQLVKYWFSVSDEEQERRLQSRLADPTRRWKLSPMDLEARLRWVEYSQSQGRDVHLHRHQAVALVRRPLRRQEGGPAQLHPPPAEHHPLRRPRSPGARASSHRARSARVRAPAHGGPDVRPRRLFLSLRYNYSGPCGATSLNPCRTGPSLPHPMRVTDAVCRWSRQDSSAPIPRAQATAALIGVTWLTTTTSPSAPGLPARRRRRARRRRPPGVDLGQRLATGRAEVRVAPPLLPHLGRDVAQRLALVLAVVDLDPALVHLRPGPEAEERRRVAGPAQGAGPQRVDRAVQQLAHRGGLRPAPSRSAPRRSGPAAGLRVGHDSPCLTRISMPARAGSGRDQNAPALVAGDHGVGRAGPGCARPPPGQLQMAAVAAVADEPGRPGALEAGPQRS
jgi:polyphosphate kinase 2